MSFWESKKVLVTGGTGFIGSHLTELLVKEGAEVSVTHLKNDSLKNIEAVKDKVKLIQADLLKLDDCLKACKDNEIVFNLAAKLAGLNFRSIHPATMFHDNTLINLNMLQAAVVSGIERFLVVSSACVYPSDAIVPTPETEGFKGMPDKSDYGYGWAKRIAELSAEMYASEFKLKVAIARLFNSYGPKDNFNASTTHVIPSFISRLYSNERVFIVRGNGRQTRSFCYVKDTVKGLLLCAEKGVGKGAINIGSSEEVSILQLVKMLYSITGKNPEIRFDDSMPEGIKRRVCDCSKAKEILGFTAETSLEKGLKETVEWYKQNFLKN